MKTQSCALSLIVAGSLVASGSAGAQQPYPDLRGTWTGQGQIVARGESEFFPNTGETGPDFREASWTLVVDRQEGSRFTAMHGRLEGTLRDLAVGVIRADRQTIHMVDHDSAFLGTLTGPDAMELCSTEITPAQIVNCMQLTRQR